MEKMPKNFSVSDDIRALSERISAELIQLSKNPLNKKSYPDSLIYIGNWQDAIPRSIWTDVTLDAIDVRSWGIIRTQAISGSAVMLSLNSLLNQSLGYSKATISKVIYKLRLSRWISLCSQIRDESGRFKGHIYAIHDKPTAINDAIYLDEDYIVFVKKCRQHNNVQIQSLARSVWTEIDQTIGRNELVLEEQSTNRIGEAFNLNSSKTRVHILNLDSNYRVQKLNLVKQPPEKTNRNEEKQALNDQVHIVNPDEPYTTTCCSSSFFNKNINTKKTTTTTTKLKQQTCEKDLIFPDPFNLSEIELAKMYLKRVEPELQQQFLDETAAQINAKRNTSKPIRNPVAFLSWLCNEHAQGNTLLSSLGIRYKENRLRKISLEQLNAMKKRELERMAKKPKQPAEANRKTTQSSNLKKFKAEVNV